jgi:hypothetical protein
MSGNEPTWSEDQEHEGAGDLYGSPQGTPRPGDESSGDVAPLEFVTPLSMDDSPEDDDAPAPLALGSDALDELESELDVVSFDDEEDAEPAPFAPVGHAERAPLRLADEAALSAEPSLGNRPAEGARVISASEIFSEDFMGAEGASDFLGLDTEFDPTPMAKSAGGLELDFRDAPDAAVATEATEDGAELGYPAPAISPPDADDYVGHDMEEDLPEGELPDGLDSELDPELDGEFDDDLFAAPRPSRKRGLLVGTLVAGLAAAGVAMYWPTLTGGGAEPVEVATVPRTPGGKSPADAPATAVDPAPDAATGDETGKDPRPIEDFASSATALDDPATDVVLDSSDAILSDPPVDVAVQPPADDVPVEDAPPTDPVDPADPAGDTASEAALRELLAQSAQQDSFYGRNAGLLDLVWRGEEIPHEAIFAGSRILTPAVGPVRVHMATTDVFEGRLFAVGEEKVWVDMELGRIGLDGTSVARIQRLPREVELRSLASADLATGDRVRAQVPGGVIYGRVRSTVGTSVTLVTDSGARITLDDPVLEPVGDKKSVVLKL